FFPGGKDELAEHAIRRAGQMYLELWERIADAAPDTATGIRDFFAGAGTVLQRSDFADACPIATVALEVASRNDALRQATAGGFESWIASVAERLGREGVASAQARELAIFAITAIEGAFVLSRALRSIEPLEIAGSAVVERMRTAVGG